MVCREEERKKEGRKRKKKNPRTPVNLSSAEAEVLISIGQSSPRELSKHPVVLAATNATWTLWIVLAYG